MQSLCLRPSIHELLRVRKRPLKKGQYQFCRGCHKIGAWDDASAWNRIYRWTSSGGAIGHCDDQPAAWRRAGAGDAHDNCERCGQCCWEWSAGGLSGGLSRCGRGDGGLRSVGSGGRGASGASAGGRHMLCRRLPVRSGGCDDGGGVELVVGRRLRRYLSQHVMRRLVAMPA